MSNINAPRGFKSSRYVDGRPYNNALNAYPIASGYGTSIFVGDPIKIVNGLVALATPGNQIRGIAAAFYGVNAAGPASNPFLAYWPGGYATQAGLNAQVLVVDDPNMLFEAAFTNSGSVPSAADLGSYFNFFNAGGNAGTGLSGCGIDYSTKSATSATFGWRFIDFVQRPTNDQTSAYSRGLFVPTLHDGRVASGAA